MLVASGVVSAAVATSLGVEVTEAAGNTDFLREDHSVLALIGLGLMVCVGAPVGEELFFRGLILQTSAKRWGSSIGIAVSTVLFTLIHFVGAGPTDTLILFAAIGTVGALLGVVTVFFDRLGTAIVIHMTFNSIAFVANSFA